MAGPVLHVMRRRDDGFAWEAVREHGGADAAVLLLQDAVAAEVPPGVRVLACREHLESRGIRTSARAVGYDEIARLLLEARAVICW